MNSRSDDQSSYRGESLRAGVRSVIERLVIVLHPERVAAIASVDERTVQGWLAGESVPSRESALALTLADRVVLELIDRMSADAVYGWFGGANPLLGGRAPALVIREGRGDRQSCEAILNAAASFLVD